LVDLDGAKKGKVMNWKVIHELQGETALQIDFGVGVKTEEDVERLLELDINQINIGSLAIKDPERFIRWLTEYGSSNFILSEDVKGEYVMIDGWLESTDLRLFELVEKYMHHGLKYLTCTDISMDGMLTGPNFTMYKKLKERFPTLNINASGGITTLDDLKQLKALSLHGAIIGKAIYEQKIKLEDLKSV
jgi:phosphoribosylformimino-5-aminoimidazole carboxamide ribotide isomerase